VIAKAVVNVTGVVGTVVQGSVQVQANADVNVLGVVGTVLLNSTLVWSDINDSQNPNWTEINDSSSVLWVDIRTPYAEIDFVDGPMFGGSAFSTSPLSTVQRIRYTPANDVWTDIAA
jgi:hypothetical protein